MAPRLILLNKLDDASQSLGPPNICVEAFGFETHLHTTVLLQHSSYFRDELCNLQDEVSSSDESTNVSNGSICSPNPPDGSDNFEHSFVSVIDEHGEWRLERREEADRSRDQYINLVDERRKCWEGMALQYVFSAMYKQPFGIRCIDELDALTRAAELINARAIVSESIDEMMGRSPEFVVHICWTAREVLACAWKLGHRRLFREALVYAVSEYSSQTGYTRDLKRLSFRPMYADFKRTGPNPLKDCQELGRLIEEKAKLLVADVANTFLLLLIAVSKHTKLAAVYSGLPETQIDQKADSDMLAQAKRVFRVIASNESFMALAGEELKATFDLLLSNQLTYQESAGPAISDVIKVRTVDAFLCTKFEDHEMLWQG